MANTKFDDNRIPVMIGVLNTDGVTPTMVKVDPSSHVMDVQDNSSGSDFGSDRATHDANDQRTLLVESSAGDGAIVPLYVNSSGQLLIKSS